MKVNYILAMYFGPRRSYAGFDRMIFLQNQLKYLETLNQDSILNNVVFSINDDGTAPREEIENTINNSNLKISYQIRWRENIGYSYANWNEVLIEYRHHEFDYHFINEDDYLPACDDWLQPFLSEFVDSTGFVCLKKSWEGFEGHKAHPTMSCGLISNKAVQTTYDKFGTVLWMYLNPTCYGHAEQCQINMMDYVEHAGYSYVGVSETYSKPFYDSARGIMDRAASPIKPPLLVPIGIDITNIGPGLV